MEHSLFLSRYRESLGAETDTRKDLKGKVFFALKGPNFNANEFAIKALEQGAIYAVVDEDIAHPKCILVNDVLTYLQDFARFYRKHLGTKIVALTGSNGKTTTKELLLSILNQKFNCTATKGNLNNHIGVPLTLLSFTKDTEVGIVEMGANNPNEISFLTHIAEPDFGLITNIGKAHLEGFGSIEGVDTAKRELFDWLEAHQKTCFINNGDPFLEKSQPKYTHKITYGSKTDPYRCISISSNGINPLEVRLQLKESAIKVTSKLIGGYNSQNILAASCVAKELGCSDQDVILGIHSYVPNNHRSQLVNGNRNTLILDAYNANPSSMLSAIKNLNELQQGTKFAILGEMKEVGANSEQAHVEVLQLLEQLRIPHILFGTQFENLRNGYTQGYFSNVERAIQTDQLLKSVNNYTILIKGSRSVGLERLVPLL